MSDVTNPNHNQNPFERTVNIHSLPQQIYLTVDSFLLIITSANDLWLYPPAPLSLPLLILHSKPRPNSNTMLPEKIIFVSRFTTVSLSLLSSYLLTVQLFTTTAAMPSYPCHSSKKTPNFDVNCTTVRLPPSICLSCPLRPPASDGAFVDCNNIFDTSVPSCHDELQQYVDLNPCDHARKAALASFRSDPTDDDARSKLDYFLYSICENCCDCIPMGRAATDYDALLESHTTNEPTLWKEDRGNCPAHAVYDVCKVLPNIQLFASADTTVQDAPAACPALNVWLSSPAASNWAVNPETQISDATRMFLSSLLLASNCKNRQIWSRCFDLEDKQGNLDLPGGSTLPPVTTLPPTTTTKPTPSPSNSASGKVSVSPSTSATSTLSPAQTNSPSLPPSLSSIPTTTSSISSSTTPKTDTMTTSPTVTSNPSGKFAQHC